MENNNVYVSPEGNYEVWKEQPEGYYTPEEWQELHPPAPPTIEEQQIAFTDAIQRRLDMFAQTRGYDNIFTACTYYPSNDPQFETEGKYAVDARDSTWRAAYVILEAVLSGQRPMPTIAEVFAELPVLQWPDSGEEFR